MPRTIIRLLTLATVTLLCLTAFAGGKGNGLPPEKIPGCAYGEPNSK